MDSNGKEVKLLKTTDGYLAVNEMIQANIQELQQHTVIVMKNEHQVDGTIIQYRATGLAIDKRHILTVNHIVYSKLKIENYYFASEGSQPLWATVTKQDPSHDIAILEIDKNAPDLPVEPMPFAKEISVGEWVVTIGHPEHGTYSLTQGSILMLSEKSHYDIDSVKLDIKIQGGNSGGFVINANGEIVGMIFCGSQVINWGYMIGKDDIQAFLD